MRENRDHRSGRVVATDPVNQTVGDDEEAAARRRVGIEIADRMRHRGVRLTGDESVAALGDLLEAVEEFEAAVEARGGDLMVDEPVGARPVDAPDDPAFVLPQREDFESLPQFSSRVLTLARGLRHRRHMRH